ADDEALVVTHRPPPCRFWSLCIWNPYMAGPNQDYGRTAVNHGSVLPNADGTVTVVIARRPLDHPHAITTTDHAEGIPAFRCFDATGAPDQPVTEVVPVADAPTVPT